MKSKQIWWEIKLCEVERIIGAPLSPTISFEGVSTHKIDQIKDLILQAEKTYDSQAAQPVEGQVAFLEIFNTRDMSAWLTFSFAGQGQEKYYISLPEISRELLKYLLYYDAVAVVEPISASIYEADAWARSLNMSSEQAKVRLGNTVFQSGLRFWAQMRPLLKAGLIITFPRSHYYPLIHSPGCNALCELDDSYPDVLDEAEEIVLGALPDEMKQICHGVTRIARGRDNLNLRTFNTKVLYCNRENYEMVPQSIFGAALYVAKGLIAGRVFKQFNAGIRQNLAYSACVLPVVEDLPVDEFIDLHRDKDTFSLWRTQLKGIIGKVDLGREGSFEEAVQDRIPLLSSHLTDQLSKYSLQSKLRTAGLSFGAGAVGAFSTTGEPLSSIVVGATTGAAELILSLLFERPTSSQKALQKVYQLISDSKSNFIQVI